MKINISKSLLFIVVFAGTLFYFFFLKDYLVRSELDETDQSNNKVVTIFNEEIDIKTERLSIDIAKPMIPEGKENLKEYLKTVKSIETYAKHGVKSTENRNYLRVKVHFTNGEILDKSTDTSCSGNRKPCLLMRVEMENGRATKIFTNGQETKDSPKETQQYISLILQKIFIEDLINHNDKYYPKIKDQKDFDREWESRK